MGTELVFSFFCITYWVEESFKDDFKIPLAEKLQFGLMDCVESRKLSEAQNCPARALFSFIQDLSTSVTSSAKIADTVNVKKNRKIPTDFHLTFFLKMGNFFLDMLLGGIQWLRGQGGGGQ